MTSAADPYVWGGQTKEQLAKRNAAIRALHLEGVHRQKLAEWFHLTESRVGQIIRGRA